MNWLSCYSHDIDVGDAQPIKQHFYRVAPAKLSYLDAEVNYMLQNNIAVPSASSWAFPCILFFCGHSDVPSRD